MKTELIKATELNAGDRIAMEYGDDNNFVVGTVIDVAEQKNWWGTITVIRFSYSDGRVCECCPDRNGMIDRVVA